VEERSCSDITAMTEFDPCRSFRWSALNSWSAGVLLKPTSSLSRHAGRPQIASVLVQDHGNDLSARVKFEVEVRVDILEKEPVLDTREDWEGGLPGDLYFKMIALKREIDCGAGIELVFADVIAERGGVEFDFLKLGRKLGRAARMEGTAALHSHRAATARLIGSLREFQSGLSFRAWEKCCLGCWVEGGRGEITCLPCVAGCLRDRGGARRRPDSHALRSWCLGVVSDG